MVDHDQQRAGPYAPRPSGIPLIDPWTSMVVPGRPPLPVVGVTLRFHKETRPLRGTREESAFADLVTDWLWG